MASRTGRGTHCTLRSECHLKRENKLENRREGEYPTPLYYAWQIKSISAKFLPTQRMPKKKQAGRSGYRRKILVAPKHGKSHNFVTWSCETRDHFPSKVKWNGVGVACVVSNMSSPIFIPDTSECLTLGYIREIASLQTPKSFDELSAPWRVH